MPKTNFISKVPDLLRAIAAGGELIMVNSPGTDYREEWWVKLDGKPGLRVLASTAKAAWRKRYILPTGVMHWFLSVAGDLAAAKPPARPKWKRGRRRAG